MSLRRCERRLLCAYLLLYYLFCCVHPLLLQVLDGLAFLHGQDIIHRDIKGGNILIGRAGVVKVMNGSCQRLLGKRSTCGGARVIAIITPPLSPPVLLLALPTTLKLADFGIATRLTTEMTVRGKKSVVGRYCLSCVCDRMCLMTNVCADRLQLLQPVLDGTGGDTNGGTDYEGGYLVAWM